MKYKPKAYPRADRKAQVLGQFQVWSDNGDTSAKTMGRIARALDLTPSPHVRDILLEMVEAGDLDCDERNEKGEFTIRYFRLSYVRTLSRVVLKRRVIVKHKGAEVGQMEMWS